jgi:hypothetical protein
MKTNKIKEELEKAGIHLEKGLDTMTTEELKQICLVLIDKLNETVQIKACEKNDGVTITGYLR